MTDLKCQLCDSLIPPITDDLTNLENELYRKDGYCSNCRSSPERQSYYKGLKLEQKEAEILFLEHINNIENPALAKKKIIVDATIASTSTAYLVPKKVKAILYEPETKDRNTIEHTIEPDNPANIELIDATSAIKNKKLSLIVEADHPQDKAIITEEKEYRNIYAVRVRPPVFSLKMDVVQNKLVDDNGYEYKCLDLFIISDQQLKLQPSSLIHIEGLPLPSPKTQKTTLLAYKVSFPEDITAYDTGKIDILKAEFEGKTAKDRLNWILDKFQDYSCIVGRRNVAAAGFLIYYTPLYAEFRGEIRNGWGNGGVIGDTTTGKSETVKKIGILLKAGMIISAESATIVGLTGAAIQSEKGAWFIDWGFLPLNDRKLIGLDGMHKISKAAIATMAEAERDGRITIVKAGKATTTARTRQIKIFNPLDEESKNFSTKSLSEFLYQCQALKTVLDEISIARLDIAVFSDSRDVTPEQINSTKKPAHDPKLYELSESLKWVWSNDASIEWEEEAEELLLKKATELERHYFYKEIPLISPDTKWKLVRLSIALAGLTLSTTDYKSIRVTSEHVNTIADFLADEYRRAGLDILAQMEHFERLTIEDVESIIANIFNQTIKHPISNIPAILNFIATKTRFTKDELMAKFELTETNQARPLLAVLQNEGLITNKKGFYATAKLNEACAVTKNFTTLTAVTTDKTKPPTPLQEKSKEEQKITEKKIDQYQQLEGGFNSNDGNAGNYGNIEGPKNSQLLIKVDDVGLKHLEPNPDFKGSETTPSDDNILYYQQVNPFVESHKCDNCGGLLATFKNPLNEEQVKQKCVKAIYSCTDCFNTAKANAENAGIKFVALPMDEPQGEDF